MIKLKVVNVTLTYRAGVVRRWSGARLRVAPDHVKVVAHLVVLPEAHVHFKRAQNCSKTKTAKTRQK